MLYSPSAVKLHLFQSIIKYKSRNPAIQLLVAISKIYICIYIKLLFIVFVPQPAEEHPMGGILI